MCIAVTSCVKRLFFTLGKASCWPPDPSQPRELCFRLLESCRQVTAPSSECFSADLEVTEQSRASSSFSVSTFTFFLRIFTEKKRMFRKAASPENHYILSIMFCGLFLFMNMCFEELHYIYYFYGKCILGPPQSQIIPFSNK